jgi:3-phenylpropionate/trans-cinnamate dioxygenase ferredoxin component
VSRERVCSKSDLPEGQVRVVTCGDRNLALSNIDGELYAIADVCSHDGGPLGEGSLRGYRVICPRHGAAFDGRTGKVLTLPAVHDVAAYPVSVDGEDVYVECDGAS